MFSGIQGLYTQNVESIKKIELIRFDFAKLKAKRKTATLKRPLRQFSTMRQK